MALDIAADAEEVLRALPPEEVDALVAMVRIIRYIAVNEGHFSEGDLEILYQRERNRAEMLRRCLSEHHAAGALDGVQVGKQCPVCKEWLTAGGIG